MAVACEHCIKLSGSVTDGPNITAYSSPASLSGGLSFKSRPGDGQSRRGFRVSLQADAWL